MVQVPKYQVPSDRFIVRANIKLSLPIFFPSLFLFLLCFFSIVTPPSFRLSPPPFFWRLNQIWSTPRVSFLRLGSQASLTATSSAQRHRQDYKTQTAHPVPINGSRRNVGKLSVLPSTMVLHTLKIGGAAGGTLGVFDPMNEPRL